MAQLFKNKSNSEANGNSHEEVQEKNESSENLEEVLETYHLELSDVHENFSDDKKEEEIYRFTFPVESSKETEESSFETEEFFFSAKSGIYSHGKNDNHFNIGVLESERSKVFCNDVSLSDDSFEVDSSELDSGISLSKQDLGGHRSNEVTTKTDTINEIVDLFRTVKKSENTMINAMII